MIKWKLLVLLALLASMLTFFKGFAGSLGYNFIKNNTGVAMHVEFKPIYCMDRPLRSDSLTVQPYSKVDFPIQISGNIKCNLFAHWHYEIKVYPVVAPYIFAQRCIETGRWTWMWLNDADDCTSSSSVKKLILSSPDDNKNVEHPTLYIGHH